MKSICFIFNKAPYGNQSAKDLLDICLMCSAFEMPITVIFQDAGVLQLVNDQLPEVLDIKNHTKTFKALSLYGVETILVDQSSLHNYQITADNILDIAEICSQTKIAETIQTSHFNIML